LKLNSTHWLQVYADGDIILDRSMCSVEKSMEALVVTNKENGLEENADKTKYMVMSRDQNAGRSHNIKTDKLLL
jgi:hypothetical protein